MLKARWEGKKGEKNRQELSEIMKAVWAARRASAQQKKEQGS